MTDDKRQTQVCTMSEYQEIDEVKISFLAEAYGD